VQLETARRQLEEERQVRHDIEKDVVVLRSSLGSLVSSNSQLRKRVLELEVENEELHRQHKIPRQDLPCPRSWDSQPDSGSPIDCTQRKDTSGSGPSCDHPVSTERSSVNKPKSAEEPPEIRSPPSSCIAAPAQKLPSSDAATQTEDQACKFQSTGTFASATTQTSEQIQAANSTDDEGDSSAGEDERTEYRPRRLRETAQRIESRKRMERSEMLGVSMQKSSNKAEFGL